LYILSIDPGTRCDNPAGGALLAFEHGDERLVETWLWSPYKGSKAAHIRIRDIAAQIGMVAQTYRLFPGILVLAYEDAWQSVNPQTFKKLANAGGSVLGIGAVLGLEALPFLPTQGKAALTGDGHAAADAMCRAARVRFGLAELPSEHIAHAIGGAIWLEGELRLARLARAAVRA
jgi:Holliday junction resolvasome RuvABC endonuclease subunit